MKEIKDHKQKIWAIAHDSNIVFHPMEIEVGKVLTTGQPFLEQFDTEEAMVERLIELAGNSDIWLQSNTDEDI